MPVAKRKTATAAAAPAKPKATRKKAARKKAATTKVSSAKPKPRRAAKKAEEAKASVDPQKTFIEIERVAYKLWEERGRQHGSDQEDWAKAEEQVLGAKDD